MYEALTRTFNIVAALLGLLILAPVLLVVSLLISMKLGRPVMFCQERAGLRGRIFRLVKFRTMTDERALNGELLPDEERMTEFGQWLRETSVDELPALWNVLVGDMNLVGPRPLLVEYLPLYSKVQARRHDVRPGITGWAAVNGRNALTWDEKFEHDVWYVDNRSFALDATILLRTISKVWKREGIAAQGSVTSPKFTRADSPSEPTD